MLKTLKKFKYVIPIAIALFVGLIAYSVYKIIPTKKPNPVALNLISLETTAQNKGRRCERNVDQSNWSERDTFCRRLQTDFITSISPKQRIYSLENTTSAKLNDEAEKQKLEEARRLIGFGADVNDPYSDKIPMNIAAEFGNRETIILLLENGANVNGADVYGKTPLMIAAAADNNEAIETLLENGADVCRKHSVEMFNSLSALDYAEKRKNDDGIKLLYQYGAGVCLNRLDPF